MDKYSSPHTRLAYRLVRYACSLLFACFSFCYLYFYQPGYLAQFQYHFSHGETTYQPLVGAVLVTLPLLLLGIFLHRAVRWPLRLSAVSWFPSAFLLAAVTSVRFPELPGYGTGTPLLALLLWLAAFLTVAFLCIIHPDASGERGEFSSYFSSNLLVLCLLFFMVGSLGYSSVSGHRELRTGRLLHEGKYAQAACCCADTAALTPRFFALRAAALAYQGQLGEHLFEYPVPAGVQGLLPAASDSLFVYDALPTLYRAMRAVPRRANHLRERDFLRKALLADSLPRPLVFDYLLCSHLLHGDLRAFTQLLPLRPDTLPATLPRHYREALALYRQSGAGVALPQSHDTRPVQSSRPQGSSQAGQGCMLQADEETEADFRRYQRLRTEARAGSEAAADSLTAYDGTYWKYFFTHFQ